MAQQLLDMIARMGGADAVGAMAARVGMSPEQAQSAMAALVPALAGGMARQASAGNGERLDQLAGAAAGMTGSAASDEAVAHGRTVAGTVLGGDDVAAAVVQKASASTGIDAGALAALLPMVATLAASVLGNGAGASSPAAGGNQGGGPGGLLGGLMGGGAASAGAGGIGGMLMNMLDRDKDGNPLDDIMGMLGKR